MEFRELVPAELPGGLELIGEDKGFSETARDITPDRRPDISQPQSRKRSWRKWSAISGKLKRNP